MSDTVCHCGKEVDPCSLKTYFEGKYATDDNGNRIYMPTAYHCSLACLWYKLWITELTRRMGAGARENG